MSSERGIGVQSIGLWVKRLFRSLGRCLWSQEITLAQSVTFNKTWSGIVVYSMSCAGGETSKEERAKSIRWARGTRGHRRMSIGWEKESLSLD